MCAGANRPVGGTIRPEGPIDEISRTPRISATTARTSGSMIFVIVVDVPS
jgi:hypothetical protein